MTTLTVLGSNGSAPIRTNPASGYLLQSGDASVWMDAGTGTFMALAGIVDPGGLSGVVISHAHVDHCADLFGLYAYLAYGPSGTVPIPVYVPEGAAARFRSFVVASDDHIFNQVLDLRTVGAGDTADVGGMSFTFGDAVHSVPGLVTRIVSGGRSLAYSGDTGPGSDLVSLAADVDVLLCETTLAGERDDDTYAYHLTAGEAGQLARAAGAKRLMITHLPSGASVDRALRESAAGYGAGTVWAEPGMVVDL